MIILSYYTHQHKPNNYTTQTTHNTYIIFTNITPNELITTLINNNMYKILRIYPINNISVLFLSIYIYYAFKSYIYPYNIYTCIHAKNTSYAYSNYLQSHLYYTKTTHALINLHLNNKHKIPVYLLCQLSQVMSKCYGCTFYKPYFSICFNNTQYFGILDTSLDCMLHTLCQMNPLSIVVVIYG